MKKMFSVLLSMCLLLSVLPTWTITINVNAEVYYAYEVLNGKATITAVDQSISGDVVIPSTLGGYPVTSIGDYVFKNCSLLESITIPNGVTSIGRFTFENCTLLGTITLPNSIQDIEDGAFKGCDSIQGGGKVIPGQRVNPHIYYAGTLEDRESIAIGNDNDDLKNSSWCYNSLGISKIDGFKYIAYTDGTAGIVGFDGDETNLVFPETVSGFVVTKIEQNAFSNRNFESITFPKSLTLIEDGAFQSQYATNFGSPLLIVYYKGEKDDYKNIIIEENNDKIVSAIWCCDFLFMEENTNYRYYITSKGTAVVAKYKGNESNLVIPTQINGYDVVEIGGQSFSDCVFLKSVSIPNTVTTIQKRAFYNCNEIRTIIIPESIVAIDDWAFSSRFMALPNYTTIDVYYGGNKSQWEYVSVGDNGLLNLSATYVHYETQASHWEMNEILQERTCVQSGKVKYVCECGYETIQLDPAVGHTYGTINVVKPTCSENGYTEYICDYCTNTVYRNYTVAPHTFLNNICKGCFLSVEECLASTHNYTSNCDNVWYVQQTNVLQISLMFSEKTKTDAGYDFIYIYDGTDNLIGTYTGTELAGKQITVTGDTVKIRLTSDDSMNYYGFSVVNISVEYSHDVNNDGVLDTNDVRFVLKSMVGLSAELTEDEVFCADFNEDGIVNSKDIRRMLLMLASEA